MAFPGLRVAQPKRRTKPVTERCFACGKPITGKPRVVITEDGGQLPWVGPDCFKRVQEAGAAGYKPAKALQQGKWVVNRGPRLFLPPSSAGSQTTVDAAFKRALCA